MEILEGSLRPARVVVPNAVRRRRLGRPGAPEGAGQAAGGRSDPERQRGKARETRAVRTWIMSTLAAGDHAAMPPLLARDVKQWLPGLSTGQLEKLLDAGLDGVSGHIHGKRPVEEVPSVRPLPLAAIEPSRRQAKQADPVLTADIERVLQLCA